MYAVGHLALGYLTGKAASKLLKAKIDVALLFVASIAPDVDFLIPGLKHRGPTHSLVVCSLAFLPIFILHRRRAIPYFVALVQHSIIGDYATDRGVQLLWPLISTWYALRGAVTSLPNIVIEWILFVACFTTMIRTREAKVLFRNHPSNLLLSIPISTVLLPSLLGFPLPVPLGLLIPHLTYLIAFSLSLLAYVQHNL